MRHLILWTALVATGCGDGDGDGPTVPARPTTVTVTPSTAEMTALGTTVQLTAEVRDQNGGVMAGVTINWTSSDAGVATVDASGLVAAEGSGTATITATAGSASGSALVTVTQSVVLVEVSPDSVTLSAIGDTAVFSAEVVTSATNAPHEIRWSSSASSVFTVNADGVVTATGNGTGIVTASVLGIEAMAAVTVKQVPITFDVSPVPLRLTAVGQTARLVAVFKDRNGHIIQGNEAEEITWSSDNPSVVTVNSDGFVVAEGVGLAHVIVRYPSLRTEGRFVNRRVTVAVGAAFDYQWASIVAGQYVTCGITTNRNAYCWGEGTLTPRSTTVPILVPGGHEWASVSVAEGGQDVHCGITTVGGVHCWTLSASAEGTLIAPLACYDLSTPNISPLVTCYGNDPGGVAGWWPRVQPTGRSLAWASLDTSSINTCGVTIHGELTCWRVYQIANFFPPVPPFRLEGYPARQAPGDHQWTSVSTGNNHGCGITESGEAYCWGRNTSGQLGDGTTTERTTPTRVVGGHQWTSISTSNGDHDLFGHIPFHTCGVTTSGEAYCWGNNWAGALGTDRVEFGALATSLEPMEVAGGHRWASVSAGTAHTCGVTVEGEAYCWGWGFYGRIGDGTDRSRLTPSLVSGNLSWALVSAGSSHTCGVTVGGEAYCWGQNFFGALGNGNGQDSLVPVPVAAW